MKCYTQLLETELFVCFFNSFIVYLTRQKISLHLFPFSAGPHTVACAQKYIMKFTKVNTLRYTDDITLFQYTLACDISFNIQSYLAHAVL